MSVTLPRLSILDATAIGPGVSATQALGWTTDVALAAEKCGFHRMWVVEHHGVADIGGSSPAVLIAHLAEATHKLRLGAGGVMLPNHAPMAIAEQFCTLQGLYPDRIDLGIGRATGAVPEASEALGSRAIIDDQDFHSRLDELSSFISGKFPKNFKYGDLKIPLKVKSPPMFLLGASLGSARTAGRRGMPYAFAHHLNPNKTREALACYRDEFQPSTQLSKPQSIVTVAVVSAQNSSDAHKAAISAAILKIRLSLASQNNLEICKDILVNSNFTAAEKEVAEHELSGGWIIIGDPCKVGEGISTLANNTGADEVMLTTIEYSGSCRLRTLNAVGQLITADQCLVA